MSQNRLFLVFMSSFFLMMFLFMAIGCFTIKNNDTEDILNCVVTAKTYVGDDCWLTFNCKGQIVRLKNMANCDGHEVMDIIQLKRK